MAVDTVGSFVETVRQLLEPEQAEEIKREQPRFSDARALAKHLIQKNYLTPFQVNQIFAGRGAGLVMGSYVIQERIGEGGMGQVFKARHRRLDRSVALKVIRKEHLQNQDAVRRFRREIQAVASLSHPNVVMAYDADQHGDTHFFVMEYVDGEPLSQLIKRHGPPPVPLAIDYLKQVAQGLQHAHERGMVHRDIKPSNLLVTKPTGNSSTRVGANVSPWGPIIKILDMGVARIVNPIDDDSISALTKEGRVVGTPDYMAPEQAVNSAKADIRADLYSLGCTCYQLLAGQVPFPGGTPMEKLLKHRMDMPKPIEQLRPEIPPALGGIIRKLLVKKPEERYQTPGELVAALDGLRFHPAMPPPPPGRPQPSPFAAGANVPMAIPLSGPIPANVPMAHPVGDSSSSWRTWFNNGSGSWRSWFGNAPGNKNLPIIVGAIVIMVLGLTFMIVALLSLGR